MGGGLGGLSPPPILCVKKQRKEGSNRLRKRGTPLRLTPTKAPLPILKLVYALEKERTSRTQSADVICGHF